MGLKSYFASHGVLEEHIFEGYCQQVPNQIEDLKYLTCENLGITNVLEIGFNVGHSADVFLNNNKKIHMFSFDIGEHAHVALGKKYIDETYPHRHTLIIGDSQMTIPKFVKDFKLKFDVIFIDGGHEYQVVHADLENCRELAHNGTVVIIDDVVYDPNKKEAWTIDPTRAWDEKKASGCISEIYSKEYCKGRGMAWGRYLVRPSVM
tara:strand:+ start:511 stop:1128 length:618 start_codon:yes stop_codon:yes gene_type:complete